jgi:dihydroflavonol-4-reductase
MVTAVTGATGHIRANLVRALLASGREVRCVVRRDRAALAAPIAPSGGERHPA